MVERFVAGKAGVDALVVTGEAGIGKTRLLTELTTLAANGGLRVLSGSATEFERAMPFALTVAALEHEVDALDPLALSRLRPDRLAELAQLFPALAPHAEAVPATLGVERYRLHAAIGALLEQLAAEQRAVLVLDDLHWADDASLELVAYLLRRPPAGVGLALAFRAGQEPAALLRALAPAVSEGRLLQLALQPLGKEDAERMLAGVEPRRRFEILRQGGGNPFYLQALAGAAHDGPGPPPALHVAIAGELSRLPPAAQQLVRAAAVVGDPFDLQLALEVAPLDGRTGMEAVQELLQRDVVRTTDEPSRFAFRHPIVRTVVREWAGEAWCLAAHGRAAAALALRDAPATARAQHLERSARPGDEDAVLVLVEAARASSARAPGTAARWYGAALRLLPAETASAARLDLLVARAVALVTAGHGAEARTTLVEALASLPRTATAERVDLVAQLARVEVMLGRAPEARALLRAALTRASDARAATLLRLQLGWVHWHASEWRSMGQGARAAMDGAREAGDVALRIDAAAQLALAEQEGGSPAAARAALDEAERLAEAASDDELAVNLNALVVLNYASVVLERYGVAARHAARLLAVARATTQEFFIVPALVGLGTARVWLGELDASADASAEAVESAHALDDPQARMWALGERCWLGVAREELEDAIRDGEDARAALMEAPAAMFGSLVPCYLGLAHLRSGAPERARELILGASGAGEHLERLGPSWRPFWSAQLAEAEIELGRLDAAEAWIARGAAWAQACDLRGRRADVERARALLELARGETCAAARAAQAAHAGYAAVGRRLDAARALVLHGRALARPGDSDTKEAVAVLRRAHDVLREGGVARSADAAALTLRGLGERVPRTRATSSPVASQGPEALSPREREIAGLVARGLTNRQIAAQLFLSPKTVESHLSRVFVKLGVPTRAGVARVLAGHDA